VVVAQLTSIRCSGAARPHSLRTSAPVLAAGVADVAVRNEHGAQRRALAVVTSSGSRRGRAYRPYYE
jgi:hypothetical protein